jgi:hypothetical protein
MVALGLAVVCVGSGGTAWAGPGGVVERDRVEVAPAGEVTISQVVVDNRLGDVRFEGHDGPEVTIYAVKRAPDDATLDRLKVSLVPDPAGPVRIATALQAAPEARPVMAGSVTIDLVILVPRAARAVATTWDGAVSLENLDGGGEATTNTGDIAIVNVSGTVLTHGGRGSQRIRQVFGAVDAEGVEGAIEIEVVRGARLGARLHDGRIKARAISAPDVELSTTRGDIEFVGEALPGGSYRLLSYHGNIAVSFGRGAAFRVDALARRGRIVAPARWSGLARAGAGLVGLVGGGPQPAALFVRSAHGDIRLGLIDAGF